MTEQGDGFALTFDEIKRHQRLAAAVWNYLGISTAEEFSQWYGKLRDDIDTMNATADEGEAWKR